jgi:hypothetical protein
VGITEIVALATAGAALVGAFGGAIRWAVGRFEKLGGKLDKIEAEHADLFRTHSLVLVRLERFRLAFQMVASELARKSPGNAALLHAKALLDDAFVVEPDLPEDLKELVAKLDARTARGGFHPI